MYQAALTGESGHGTEMFEYPAKLKRETPDNSIMYGSRQLRSTFHCGNAKPTHNVLRFTKKGLREGSSHTLYHVRLFCFVAFAAIPGA
jgi:hypothetical protein